MTRRKSEFTPNILSVGKVSLNRETYELLSEDMSFRLGNKEFQMMEMLISRPNRLISTEQFLENIWGYDSDVEINVVWVYISYLRKKLIMLNADLEIKAARGMGYTLVQKNDQ
jgi:DNA-binding response OmpR family regulator